jgi:chromate reductase, NAD(P)H dehydrogenase (quinone)
MITVISATNRKNSETLKIAKHYASLLENNATEEVRLLDLCLLPNDIIHDDMYSIEGQSLALRSIQEEYMVAADKFVFVVPEYNGSVPGILKLFIDACSVYRMKDTFKRGDKKALLVGVSSGRAGNLRGMIHLTGMLNYLNITVHPNQLPISKVDTLLNESAEVVDAETLKVTKLHVEDFLKSFKAA